MSMINHTAITFYGADFQDEFRVHVMVAEARMACKSGRFESG